MAETLRSSVASARLTSCWRKANVVPIGRIVAEKPADALIANGSTMISTENKRLIAVTEIPSVINNPIVRS
jgi:hypothetical protein